MSIICENKEHFSEKECQPDKCIKILCFTPVINGNTECFYVVPGVLLCTVFLNTVFILSLYPVTTLTIIQQMKESRSPQTIRKIEQKEIRKVMCKSNKNAHIAIKIYVDLCI